MGVLKGGGIPRVRFTCLALQRERFLGEFLAWHSKEREVGGEGYIAKGWEAFGLVVDRRMRHLRGQFTQILFIKSFEFIKSFVKC